MLLSCVFNYNNNCRKRGTIRDCFWWSPGLLPFSPPFHSCSSSKSYMSMRTLTARNAPQYGQFFIWSFYSIRNLSGTWNPLFFSFPGLNYPTSSPLVLLRGRKSSHSEGVLRRDRRSFPLASLDKREVGNRRRRRGVMGLLFQSRNSMWLTCRNEYTVLLDREGERRASARNSAENTSVRAYFLFDTNDFISFRWFHHSTPRPYEMSGFGCKNWRRYVIMGYDLQE